MDNQEPNVEQAAEALIAFAAERMKKGASDAEIESELKAKGLSEEASRTIISKLRPVYDEAKDKAGRKNMIVGALWCVGGLIATILGMSLGGGRYILFWGAIVFGAVQFFRGVAQYTGRAARPAESAQAFRIAPAVDAGSPAKEPLAMGGGTSSSQPPVFTPWRAKRGTVFHKWNSLPETTVQAIADAAARTGAGGPLAFRAYSPARLIPKRIPIAAASLAVGVIWYLARLGNSANGTVDLVVFCLASFGVLFSAGLFAYDLQRLKKLPMKPGCYAFPSCVAETQPSGIALHPLESASMIWSPRAEDPRIEIAFTNASFSFPVAEGAQEEICGALEKLRKTAATNADPFVRFSLLDGGLAPADSAVWKSESLIPPLVPIAGAAAVLAVLAGYGLWMLFSRTSDEAMYARLMRDLSTPAYLEYRSKGGRLHDVSTPDLEKADKAKAVLHFETVKLETSVKAWRAFLEENRDPGLAEAARKEIDDLYGKAYAQLLSMAPENKELAVFIKGLFERFKEKNTSALMVRFVPPTKESLELNDKLIEAVSDLDEKVAPISPCFEDGDEWLNYAGVTRRLGAGLGLFLPYGTIEAEVDGSEQADPEAPVLLVDCLLVPNGSVYEDNDFGTEDAALYKYFAGFDVLFELHFKLSESDPGYSCELSVSPPDEFQTSTSKNLTKSTYMTTMIYRTMIGEAFAGLSDQVLESVLHIEVDEEMREKLRLSELDGLLNKPR